MFTAESALALFFMLGVSSFALLLAAKIKVPHTVVLVGIGILLGALSFTAPFDFIDDITLTPELLFYIFLPTLIFESAFNIQIKRLTDDAIVISMLSIISLILSAVAIAFGIDFIFSLLGFDIPFILALIFGSIISATDPVAVLALFKEYGAPRRLSLIFEGESIFNDGTGVALFLVVLAIAESGVYGMESILEGSLSFVVMVTGGILFGLVFGWMFVRLIELTRANEFASITLTLVLAHTTFICAELLSQNLVIGGHHYHISAIIATAVASLLMGNYGRYKIQPHASEFLEKYWSHFAFLANSLIFILIGMLVIQLPAATPSLMLPIGLAIVIVAISRALSIYPVVSLFNLFSKKKNDVPLSWQHVLAWGSLRGALAVTMVLLIPDTLSFPGWAFDFTPKELVLTLTVSCVFATLFIKGTTVGALMNRLKLNSFTEIEEINHREMSIFIYNAALKQLEETYAKGYIPKATYEIVHKEQTDRIAAVLEELKAVSTKHPDIFEKVIALHAMGIERRYARELFQYGEIPEAVVKRIMSKLEFQTHAIEKDNLDHTTYEHGHTEDVFELLAKPVQMVKQRRTAHMEHIDLYLYYRALAIISRKVVKQLTKLDASFSDDFIVAHDVIQRISERYTAYKEGSTKKMEELRTQDEATFKTLDLSLARKAVLKTEMSHLENLKEREMVTPKVSIALEERFHSENHKAA